MSLTPPATPSVQLQRQLALAFAPLDKRALGLAMGITVALLVVVATVLSIVLDPQQRFPLYLLQNYFYGYALTWTGVVVGAWWGFVAGFAWGWFAAFARNLVLAVWLMTIRIRNDFSTSRDFLDHL
ncbi:MAG: hypothetical protein LCH84_02665 [Gemmatimonadetes bacterium]|nr:hypothetical protein [Gemmatimonadota bacterium]